MIAQLQLSKRGSMNQVRWWLSYPCGNQLFFQFLNAFSTLISFRLLDIDFNNSFEFCLYFKSCLALANTASYWFSHFNLFLKTKVLNALHWTGKVSLLTRVGITTLFNFTFYDSLYRLLSVVASSSSSSESPPFCMGGGTFSSKFWKGGSPKKMTAWGDLKSSCHGYLSGELTMFLVKKRLKNKIAMALRALLQMLILACFSQTTN